MNRKKLISFLMAFIMTFSILFNFGGNGYLKAFAKDGENTISVEQKKDIKNTTSSAIEVDEKETSKNTTPLESGVEENKENKTTASIEPTFIEVNQGDSFTFNVKTPKGEVLSYSSNIPGEGVGFGNSFVFVDDGKAKIKLKSDVKPGEYKLSNVGIYDIAGRNPGMIIMNISDNYKVASLPDITIKVKGQTKSVDSISLNKTELNLTVNKTETLVATVLPEDASNKGIKWTSKNQDIASVDENGQVTGLKEGTAIITAKTDDGEKTSNCTVNVKAAETNTNKKDYKTLVSDSIDKASIKAVEEYNSLDWVAVGLYRSGKGDKIPTEYLSDTGKYLINPENQDMFASKPTEFERITLGVLSANGNPKNVEGMSLIRKIYNADLSSQGINAIVFGLIALDAGQYNVPKDAVWDREKLINSILDNECTNDNNEKFQDKKGGWSFGGGNADPDMTGMAITALAPYYSGSPEKVSNQISSELKTKVKEAVDRAVDCLSEIQDNDGGYSTWGSSSSESCAQVVTGLCANKIDPTEKRLTKGDKNVIDALLSYQTEDGGFAHTADYGKRTNGMATEQALYALAQYSMYQNGLGSIYDFGDKNSQKDASITNVTGVQLDATELILEKKGSQRLQVKVLPAIADNLKVKWESSNDKVATVSKDGMIEAVDPGEATITVTSYDGGKTATCKVEVVEKLELTVNPKNAKMNVGDTLQLKSIFVPEKATKGVVWSSSEDDVAKVDQNGKVEALTEGKTNITVRTPDWKLSAECEITVTKGSLANSLKIENIENTKIKTGDKIQLKTKVLDKDNNVINDSKTIWTTSNDKVATVDNTGNVIAIGPGTVVISAALEGNDSIKDQVTFNVTSKEEQTTKQIKAHIAVVGMYNEILFSPQEITVNYVGEKPNAYDVLKATGLATEKIQESGFVTSIGGQKNGGDKATYFAQSGWQYKVNEKYPSVAPINYEIKDGDYIGFYYLNNGDILPEWDSKNNPFISVNVKEVNKDNGFNDKVTVLKGKSCAAAIIETLKKNKIDFDIERDSIKDGIIMTKEGKIYAYIVNEDESAFCKNEKLLNGGETIKVYLDDLTHGYSKITLDKDKFDVGQAIKVTVQKLDYGSEKYEAEKEAVVHFNGKEFKTDETGVVSITPDKVGDFEVYADGEDIIPTEKIKINVKEAENKKVKIENVTEQKEFAKGREAKITVKATNISDKVQSATLIVGLFDSQGELVNYVASTQDIKVGENTELTGRIKLSNADGYTIKAFVWDSIEGMKYLSDEIIIPVK